MEQVRIRACLKGIAIGDAIGKQTETLAHQDVRRWYPDWVRGFEGPPDTVIPRYVGNRKREWRVGETTAAAATAAAVSAAIDGGSADDIIELAQHAGAAAAPDGAESLHNSFSLAVRAIYADLQHSGRVQPAELAAKYFPITPLTIVPLALALGSTMNSAEEAILLATNVGGDSDSVASIAAAIAGARFPDTINDAWFAIVEAVNGHDLVSLADALGRLRR